MKLRSLLAIGVSLLYAAPAAASADFTGDSSRSLDKWRPDFSILRGFMSPAAKFDPGDPRVSVSGFINATYDVDLQRNVNLLLITSSYSSGSSTNQYFVVETESGDGWHRTSQAIYIRPLDFGTSTFDRAGLNLIGPSNYCRTGGNEDDPCDAAAYILYAVHETGQVCINKRYEWPSKLAAAKCEQIPGFEDGMPLNKLIGLQLVTYPRDDGDVRVVAYVDVPGDGQGWIPLIDHLDTPGTWPSIQPISARCQAKVTNGQTFSDSGKKCLALQGFGDTKMPVESPVGGNVRTLFQAVNEAPTRAPTFRPTLPPVSPTPVPPTPAPPTPVPLTPVPATPVPPTPVPPTPVPLTPVPATPVPPTPVPPTSVPLTPVPATPVPLTPVPPTPVQDEVSQELPDNGPVESKNTVATGTGVAVAGLACALGGGAFFIYKRRRGMGTDDSSQDDDPCDVV